MTRIVVLLLVSLAAAGCRSTTGRLESMERAGLEELQELGVAAELDRDVARRQAARCEAVRELVDAGALEGAGDRLLAARVLARSLQYDDLLLAQGLAEEAAREGEAAGLALAAEAEDKRRVLAGQPQRYGTRIVYDPKTKRFALAPRDPTTTDAQRAATGLPPLAELERRAAVLNQLEAGRE